MTIHATRRHVNNHAHPELVDAVAVSRFWRSVQIGQPDECWPWQGDSDDGYGVFYYQGRMRRASELSLSFTTGEKRLPSLDTCHSCDNPPCVNPAHLRFDTRKSNVRDMVDRGRASRSAARLTEADVVLIRERRAAGARQIDLAEQFGISSAQVSNIIRGRQWATAAGPIESERKYRRG